MPTSWNALLPELRAQTRERRRTVLEVANFVDSERPGNAGVVGFAGDATRVGRTPSIQRLQALVAAGGDVGLLCLRNVIPCIIKLTVSTALGAH